MSRWAYDEDADAPFCRANGTLEQHRRLARSRTTRYEEAALCKRFCSSSSTETAKATAPITSSWRGDRLWRAYCGRLMVSHCCLHMPYSASSLQLRTRRSSIILAACLRLTVYTSVRY